MSGIIASPCGDECRKGVKHSGTSTGETVDIGGVKTYVACAPSKSTEKIIIFYTDVHGPWHLNNQLLMDWYATHGYLVVGPDYYEGDFLEEMEKDPKFNFQAWVGPKREIAGGIIDKNFLPALKEKYGARLYAAVGYCFGARDVFRTVSSGFAAAGAVGHPAFLGEEDFQEMTKGAILLSCAESDGTFSTEGRHKAEEILASIKASYHFQLFSGVKHGFAIRGDPEVENERWAKEQSAWGVIGWFNRWLK